MRRVGIDTNVLLRLLVDDDEAQRKRVRAFGTGLNKSHQGLITLLGILEVDWALRSQYGFTRRQCAHALRKLMQIRGVAVESHDVVVRALALVEDANADLADALIAERALELGCEATVTLDKKAASRIPSMTLLA